MFTEATEPINRTKRGNCKIKSECAFFFPSLFFSFFFLFSFFFPYNNEIKLLSKSTRANYGPKYTIPIHIFLQLYSLQNESGITHALIHIVGKAQLKIDAQFHRQSMIDCCDFGGGRDDGERDDGDYEDDRRS